MQPMQPMQQNLYLYPANVNPPEEVLTFFQNEAGWTEKLVNRKPLLLNKYTYVQWLTLTDGPVSLAIARLKIAPPEFCFVSNFILAKDYRLQGYGRSLMTEIEDLARAKNLKRVVLQATGESNLFYEKLGYLKSRKLKGFLVKALFQAAK